jgi:Mrp family chromosome partitioning ATPase
LPEIHAILRAIRRRTSRSNKIVAIAGDNARVGHVTIALARLAASETCRVLIIDIEHGDVSRYLSCPADFDAATNDGPSPRPINPWLAVCTLAEVPGRTKAQALTAPAFAELIAAARKEWDFVLLALPTDLAPLEIDIAADRADAVLLLARAGITPMAFIDAVTHHGTSTAQKLVGIVIDAAPSLHPPGSNEVHT